MKLIVLFAILDIVLCIQHGADVSDITQYPFYIMIGNPHICGGTLLSYDPPLVLTSAHCIADAEFHPSDKSRRNPYFVNYNNAYRDKQKSMSIIDWSVHPLYNVSNNVNQNYDVAIVKLATPLTQSSRIKRVPLWSPSMEITPKRGELIGFGYTGLDEPESPILKRMQLDITRFQSNGSFNIEAKTDMEQRIACHGDSGSPLIVYQSVLNPATNKHETVPFVTGNLARIFGAHDAGPTRLTCPIPHKPDHKDEISDAHPYRNGPSYVPVDQRPENNVIESFCNISAMLDWISKVTGISKQDLSDPFYSPPCHDCKGPRDINMDDDADDNQGNINGLEWHIGVVTHDFLNKQNSHLWIGGMNQDDFSVQAVPAASNTQSLFHDIHFSFVLFTIFIFIFNY